MPWDSAMNKGLYLLGGVALVGLALGGKKGARVVSGLFGRAFDFAKAQAFALALPANVARWTPQFLNAAQKYGVDPWALAGICYNESRGGDALTPPGPAGTGDFIPRSPSHATFKYANPATGLPPDGKGWGRGLMQIDYGVHHAWVTTSAWWDPQVNINKAAEILKERLNFFSSPPGPNIGIECWRIHRGLPQYGILPWKEKYPNAPYPPCAPTQTGSAGSYKDPRPLTGAKLYEAAIAAYNTSYGAVLQALALGLPAEAGTAHQSYVTNFLARVAAWSRNFS
jgi:hypothetical protein